jgi:hypothetical protein
MIKKLLLKLIRKRLGDREFAINVCKQIHNYHQTQFDEQTPPGRFIEACEEFFEAAPEFMKKDFYRNCVISAFESTKKYVLDNPERFPEKSI